MAVPADGAPVSPNPLFPMGVPDVKKFSISNRAKGEIAPKMVEVSPSQFLGVAVGYGLTKLVTLIGSVSDTLAEVPAPNVGHSWR
jgi:hypothetical protein